MIILHSFVQVQSDAMPSFTTITNFAIMLSQHATQGFNLLQISTNWFLGNWTRYPRLKCAKLCGPFFIGRIKIRPQTNILLEPNERFSWAKLAYFDFFSTNFIMQNYIHNIVGNASTSCKVKITFYKLCKWI